MDGPETRLGPTCTASDDEPDDDQSNSAVTDKISMKLSPLETLPSDVVDRILIFLPDFLSLRAVVLSTPCVHDVFAARRATILEAVLSRDLVPHARALYYASTNQSSKPSDECMLKPYKLCLRAVSVDEERMLSHYKQTAERYEAYCTTLWKNRHATCNELTSTEKLYFERAFYRYWTLAAFANRMPWTRVISARQNNFEDLKIFLSSVGREEILQLKDVHSIMRTLAQWYSGGARISNLPDDTLQTLDSGVFRGPYTSPCRLVLEGVLGTTYKRGGMSVSWETVGMAILVDTPIDRVPCPRCDKETDMLWGKDNWHLFRCFETVPNLILYMPGNLVINQRLQYDLGEYASIPHYAPIMYNEILENSDAARADWSSELYLCQSCFANCLGRGAFQWYLQKKFSEGPLEPNCPEGWNCNQQGEWQHIHDLNHLCPPEPT